MDLGVDVRSVMVLLCLTAGGYSAYQQWQKCDVMA